MTLTIFLIFLAVFLIGAMIGGILASREAVQSIKWQVTIIARELRNAIEILGDTKGIYDRGIWTRVCLDLLKDLPTIRIDSIAKPPDHIHPFTFGEPDNDTERTK